MNIIMCKVLSVSPKNIYGPKHLEMACCVCYEVAQKYLLQYCNSHRKRICGFNPLGSKITHYFTQCGMAEPGQTLRQAGNEPESTHKLGPVQNAYYRLLENYVSNAAYI